MQASSRIIRQCSNSGSTHHKAPRASTNNNKHDTWKEQIYCPIHKHHPRMNLRPKSSHSNLPLGNINPVPSSNLESPNNTSDITLNAYSECRPQLHNICNGYIPPMPTTIQFQVANTSPETA